MTLTGLNSKWLLVGLLVMLHILMSVRVALAAGRMGKRPLKWFFITLCCSGLPSAIIFPREMKRQLREQAQRAGTSPVGNISRCPHCQTLIAPEELSPLAIPVCPRCHMRIDKVDLA